MEPSSSSSMKKYLILITIIGCLNCISAAPKRRICLKYSSSLSSASYESDDSGQDYDYQNDIPLESNNLELNDRDDEEICQSDFDFCFALWKFDKNSTATILKSGCWKLSEGVGPCKQENCISTSSAGPGTPNLHFCCCSTDYCNRNMTVNESAEAMKSAISSDTENSDMKNSKSFWLSPILLICLPIGLIVIMIAIYVFNCKKPIKPGPETAPLAPSGPGYSSNLQNVDNLKVCSMIGQGKYGTVWKGMINEQTVAVKIFPAQHKQYFINERNIYSLPLMDNPSLLSYFGCDERRTLDDNIEYFLVLSLAPLGCLQDWLIENVASYSIFYKMAKSLTHGLSHLHTEIKKGDEIKPCVCHRDLNTRNILVKSDLSCCISDFGFALKVFGSRYEYKGEMAVAETKSINEVGTFRYMAPEILEGAVNLRDCETALKQIDVYSLGLVLWELCTRCQDLYPPGQQVPPYKAPYEAEVGKNPTFEQMQVLVSRHKARPLFPPGWGGGAAAKLARDTCEDCWDHDAEARLTALCAEERVQELSNLRPRSHINRGPSPPLSANNLAPNKMPTIEAKTTTTTSNFCNHHTIETDGVVITPPNQMVPTTKNELSPMIVQINSPITEKNHIVYTQQIQPYQGRNPCQERNLAPVTKPNQILVEKSKKHSFLERGQENSLSCLEDDVSVEELISSTSSNNRRNIEQPILGEGFPKQNNTDKKLRGWHGVRALIQKKLFRRDSYRSEFNYDEKSNLVDNKIKIRINTNNSRPNATSGTTTTTLLSPTKDITVNLVENKYNRYQNGSVQTKIEIPNLHRPSNLDLTPITVRVNGLSDEINTKSSNLNSQQCHHQHHQHHHNHENVITNTQNSTNSTSSFKGINTSSVLAGNNHDGLCNNDDNNDVDDIDGGGIDDTVIAEDFRDELDGFRSPPRLVISRSANAVKNLNTSTSINSSNSTNTIMEDKQLKRQRSLEVFKEVFGSKCNSTDRLRDPSQRVKTPGDVPPSVRKVRAIKTLSLYDDRMMDSSILNPL